MVIMSKKIKVLFVCLGNICRSPTAEAAFKQVVSDGQVDHFFEIDSAGTNGLHDGETADPRTIQHGKKHGLVVDSISRQIRFPKDFEYFDYIIGMDNNNISTLQRLDKNSQFVAKILPLAKFCSDKTTTHVPDPYYGGSDGFERVIAIVQDGAKGLFSFIQRNNPELVSK